MTMLRALPDLPSGILGVRAFGKVTKDDYVKVLEPLLAAAREEGRRVLFLYELGPEFESYSPGAFWEDAKVNLRFELQFDGCAVVTDVGWIRESLRFTSFLVPCAVKVFRNGERDQAVAWLEAIRSGPGIAHRLISDLGVLVVEPTAPLRGQDFKALGATADAWIEAHGELHGIVVHAREFPGWENLAGLLSHLRFVRDHHRKIGRVALAVDGRLATLAPRIAEHFVKAELKSFEYGKLDDAIAWAAEGREPAPSSNPQGTEAHKP
jgi:hypothetical protein